MRGHNGPPTFSSESGWVAIARSIRSHPLVGIHLFAKPMDANRGAVQPMSAFIDLIMECRYEDGFVVNGGRKMEVQRGQLVGAVSWLAARWNWTPMAVRIWLDKLESDMMISRFVPGSSKDNKHVGRASTIISLCNYDQYQQSATNAQQSKQQTSNNQTTNEQQQYKDNKGTREQGNNTFSSAFQAEEEGNNIPAIREPNVREAGIKASNSKHQRAPSRSKRWQLPEDKLDGSSGILFEDGKLSVFNGTAVALAKDFPGLDLQAVCNKAAAKISQMKDPTHLQAVAVIRQYCQYAKDDMDRKGSSGTATASGGLFAGLSPKYRERLDKGGSNA